MTDDDRRMLMDIRESLARLETRFDDISRRLCVVEDNWSRVMWGALGAIGIAISSLIFVFKGI